VLGRDRSYFVQKKNHSDSTKKVLWNWYHQHICFLWGTCFSTNSRHTYGYKLCSSSLRLVPLFVWGRLHTEAWKETSPIL
jgi:hypothetical protein